ncbi:MAG: hypothetical protein IJB79_02320 [Candidatus Gastranaerophilales bacterium]|nr:hypothetical protein [Candidatus Gastranaerophilales bacterium]
MKYIKLLFLICATLFSTQAFGAHQLYADIDGINIPYGTKLELQMAENITTKSISQGDMFQAYLTKDIYVNNKLILPSKSIFRGRVVSMEPSRSLSRPAKITLNLDHLVTKYGMQLPINSGIASNFEYILKSDGSLTTNGNYFSATKADLKKSGSILPKTVKWGATAGDDLFKGAKILFVPISAVAGTIATVCSGGYNIISNLFEHGDEIIIKKGTAFNIILLAKLDVPS